MQTSSTSGRGLAPASPPLAEEQPKEGSRSPTAATQALPGEFATRSAGFKPDDRPRTSSPAADRHGASGKRPETAGTTMLALEARRLGRTNLRIDKRSVPPTDPGQTTKIVGQAGNLFELLGTLDARHSAELQELYGITVSGRATLGAGKDGKIRYARAINGDTGEPEYFVAVKKFESETAARREYGSLTQIAPHPSLAQAYDIAAVPSASGKPTFYVFIKLTPGINLEDRRTGLLEDLAHPARKPQAERKVRRFSEGMLTAAAALHEQDYFHRDIALRNFIERAKDGLIILCDFARASTTDARNPRESDARKLAIALLQLCTPNGETDIVVKDLDGDSRRMPTRLLPLNRHDLDIESIRGETLEEVAARILLGMSAREALKLPYFARTDLK